MANLHVFAINTATDVRHTFLSRSKGDTAPLPDVAGWLGLRQGGVDKDAIEIFPIEDLSGLSLTDYLRTAFDPEDAGLSAAAARLNALEGHVLLAPDAAFAGSWTPGPDLTLVASLPLPEADHSSQVLTPTPAAEPAAAQPAPPVTNEKRSTLVPAVIVAFVLAVILFAVSNFW